MRRLKECFGVAIGLLCGTSALWAQRPLVITKAANLSGKAAVSSAKANTPKPGSAIRTDILDALRDPVQETLKQKILFFVGKMRVADGWAFLIGRPIQRNGRKVDYRLTKYADICKKGKFDDRVVALLHGERKHWKVVVYNIGGQGRLWSDWAKRFGAPKTVFR